MGTIGAVGAELQEMQVVSELVLLEFGAGQGSFSHLLTVAHPTNCRVKTLVLRNGYQFEGQILL